MFINQHQRDEFDLAMSYYRHGYKEPVKQIIERGISRDGFTREEVVELATEYYRDIGNAGRDEFFRKHRTCRAMFYRTMDWFKLDIKRYYRIDDGQIYRMEWLHPNEIMKRDPRVTRAITRFRNVAFEKGHPDTRELFVELANVQYCHYYKRPKEFREVLRKVDISNGTYYHRIKKYNIKAEVFMSIDNGELFRVKCKSLNNSD
ncbi:hypothetical protein J9089_003245 [Salmonella enterica]|nr:hypothetical protein [Salmonella enterica]EHI7757777.1 hypothetical protein [Salmonella enterica]EHI8762920.1 hypothetical protein [Salmonella enterica]